MQQPPVMLRVILGWVARMLSSVTHVAPWMVSHQAPLSMEFFRQDYCSWLPFPTPEDLLDPGVEPISLASLGLGGRFFI